MIEYQLIRSARRKTLGLQVKQGKVFVRAPAFISIEQIDHFVALKSVWLRAKINQQNSFPQTEAMTFSQNSLIWVLGEQKRLTISFQPIAQVLNLKDELRVVISTRSRMALFNGLLPEPTKLANKVKQQLEAWFKEQSLLYLKQKLPELSRLCQCYPNTYAVKKYKARWGSCNSKGELSFNYLLMMVPPWVFDYVIVHELCHLTHLNHSDRFWSLVAKHFPHYSEAKTWLKSHQSQLAWC